MSLEYSMNVQLLAEHYFEFLSLKGGCRGSSMPTLVKMPHFFKFHSTAHIISWNHITAVALHLDLHRHFRIHYTIVSWMPIGPIAFAKICLELEL